MSDLGADRYLPVNAEYRFIQESVLWYWHKVTARS